MGEGLHIDVHSSSVLVGLSLEWTLSKIFPGHQVVTDQILERDGPVRDKRACWVSTGSRFLS